MAAVMPQQPQRGAVATQPHRQARGPCRQPSDARFLVDAQAMESSIIASGGWSGGKSDRSAHARGRFEP